MGHKSAMLPCRILTGMVLIAAVTSQPQSPSQICSNTWLSEPNTFSEPINCNILGTSTTIQSVCRVRVDTNTGNLRDRKVAVRWYYSTTREDAGRNGTILSRNTAEMNVTYFNMTDSTIIGATLYFTKIPSGYYWCQIENPQSGSIQNPSRIIFINELCDRGKPCDSIVAIGQYPSGRCASGNYHENLTIVDLQNQTECTDSTTTTEQDSENIEDKETVTTEREHKPPTDLGKTTTHMRTETTANTDSDGKTTGVSISVDGNEQSKTDSDGKTTGVSISADGNDQSAILISLLVGVGIVLLLIVIITLLVLIMCLYYFGKKKVVNDDSGMPNHFNNMAYQTTELGYSHSLSDSTLHKEADSTDVGNHTYAEIPPNFTIAAFGSKKMNKQHNGNDYCSDVGHYEVPLKTGGESDTSDPKHEYEVVVNEDKDDYSRLEQTGSIHRKVSASASISASVTSPLERDAMLRSFSLKDSEIFDNPSYSQFNKQPQVRKRVDIYRSTSTDSNSGGSQNHPPNEILVPNDRDEDYSMLYDDREREKDVSNDDRENNSDFQDSSMFLVTGLAKDDTSHKKTLYTSIGLPNEENDYTFPIVSTEEKYISEQGHIYQVLEEVKKEEVESVTIDEKTREDGNKETISIPPTQSVGEKNSQSSNGTGSSGVLDAPPMNHTLANKVDSDVPGQTATKSLLNGQVIPGKDLNNV